MALYNTRCARPSDVRPWPGLIMIRLPRHTLHTPLCPEVTPSSRRLFADKSVSVGTQSQKAGSIFSHKYELSALPLIIHHQPGIVHARLPVPAASRTAHGARRTAHCSSTVSLFAVGFPCLRTRRRDARRGEARHDKSTTESRRRQPGMR